MHEMFLESPFGVLLTPLKIFLTLVIVSLGLLRIFTHLSKADVWIIAGLANMALFVWFPALVFSVPYITGMFVVVAVMAMVQFTQWRAQKRKCQ